MNWTKKLARFAPPGDDLRTAFIAYVLALLVFDQPVIGQVLCLVTCAQSLIFCGTYWYYNKKY